MVNEFYTELGVHFRTPATKENHRLEILIRNALQKLKPTSRHS